MTKPILYFAHWCPDTEPFVVELERLGVEFDECDITKGVAEAYYASREALGFPGCKK